MHLCGLFVDSLKEGLGSYMDGSYDHDRFRSFMRVLGLLHDLGHGPWSHNFDVEILGRLYSNNALRQSVLGKRTLLGMNHEFVGASLVKASLSANDNGLAELGTALRDFDPDIDPDELCKELQGSRPPVSDVAGKESKETRLTPRESIIHSILRGAYSADRIDFLLRDSYYAGTKEYGTIDWRRLINTSYVGETAVGKVGLFLQKRSVHTLFSFMVAYHSMFSAVYYHRTCRIVNLLTGEFLRELFIDDQKETRDSDVSKDESEEANDNRIVRFLTDPEEFIGLDEHSVVCLGLGSPNPSTAQLAKRITERKLPYKLLEEKYWKPTLGLFDLKEAQKMLDGNSSDIRKEMDDYLEQDNVADCWYYIDHPAGKESTRGNTRQLRGCSEGGRGWNPSRCIRCISSFEGISESHFSDPCVR